MLLVLINDQALLARRRDIRDKEKPKETKRRGGGRNSRRDCAEYFPTRILNVNVLFTCRIGTFFSPVMPTMGVVKLFIIFYVELVCVAF